MMKILRVLSGNMSLIMRGEICLARSRSWRRNRSYRWSVRGGQCWARYFTKDWTSTFINNRGFLVLGKKQQQLMARTRSSCMFCFSYPSHVVTRCVDFVLRCSSHTNAHKLTTVLIVLLREFLRKAMMSFWTLVSETPVFLNFGVRNTGSHTIIWAWAKEW